jgi:hypothetical protein
MTAFVSARGRIGDLPLGLDAHVEPARSEPRGGDIGRARRRNSSIDASQSFMKFGYEYTGRKVSGLTENFAPSLCLGRFNLSLHCGALRCSNGEALRCRT